MKMDRGVGLGVELYVYLLLSRKDRCWLIWVISAKAML